MTPKTIKETLINSEISYQGYFLKVKKDTVQLPDGSISTRESILHPGASAVVPYLGDGQFLMIEQYRTPLQQTYLEFPAGKIDPNEKPEETAIRELKEEAGCACTSLEFLTEIHPVIGYSNEIIYLYLAKGLSIGEQSLDQGEFIKTLQISASDLQKKIWSHQIPDVKTQIAALWALRALGLS